MTCARYVWRRKQCVFIHICVYMYIYICTCIYISMYIHIHVCIHTHTSFSLYISVEWSRFLCLYAADSDINYITIQMCLTLEGLVLPTDIEKVQPYYCSVQPIKTKTSRISSTNYLSPKFKMSILLSVTNKNSLPRVIKQSNLTTCRFYW